MRFGSGDKVIVVKCDVRSPTVQKVTNPYLGCTGVIKRIYKQAGYGYDFGVIFSNGLLINYKECELKLATELTKAIYE